MNKAKPSHPKEERYIAPMSVGECKQRLKNLQQGGFLKPLIQVDFTEQDSGWRFQVRQSVNNKEAIWIRGSLHPRDAASTYVRIETPHSPAWFAQGCLIGLGVVFVIGLILLPSSAWLALTIVALISLGAVIWMWYSTSEGQDTLMQRIADALKRSQAVVDAEENPK